MITGQSLQRLTQISSPLLSSITSYVDKVLNSQIDGLLSSIKDELEDACEIYLTTINGWIPVLTDKDLQYHLSQLETQLPIGSLKPEVGVLFLIVYLVTLVPAEFDESIIQLYSVVKSCHTIFQSSAPSLDVIRAGILLSIYEHGQSLDQACYLTIGACARMGYAMGLHQTLSEKPPSNPVDLVSFATKRHIWWTIIITER